MYALGEGILLVDLFGNLKEHNIKNSYYFPHDYHARFDPKLCALIKNYGMEGYGTWWMLVEIMHEQGGKIEKFPKLFEGLAHDLKQNEAHLKQIISALINDFCLLKEDDMYIWSIRVLRNMDNLLQKRLQKVEAGRLGGIKSGEKRAKKRSKTKQNEAPLEANEPKESKVKESKVKNMHNEFVYLTNQEYEKLISGYGETVTKEYINKLNDYIGAKGVKYKSHYHTICMWISKEPKTGYKAPLVKKP